MKRTSAADEFESILRARRLLFCEPHLHGNRKQQSAEITESNICRKLTKMRSQQGSTMTTAEREDRAG